MQKIIIFFVFIFLSLNSQAEEILIAAAADLKFALDGIVRDFNKSYPNEKVKVTYGSSGTFFLHIQQGAPYDLYFSADIDYPKKLEAMNLTSSTVKQYGVGRIVIWSSQVEASKLTLKNLNEKSIVKIALANPKHAPYGKRAVEALQSVGVYDSVAKKFVLAENVSQAAQWVHTGNADIGIIALSLALSDEMKGKGSFSIIEEKLHQRLEQGYVITKAGANKKLSQKFADYMSTKPARMVLERYGFVMPY